MQWHGEARAKVLAELFPEQSSVVRSWLGGTRLIAVCCSRRAGKTQMLVRMIVLSLLMSGRDEWTVYAAQTLGVAREIIWNELEALVKRLGLPWKLTEHHGTISTPCGAEFRLCGVSEKKSVEKVRGKKYRLFICDEASTYPDLIEPLIKNAVRPGLVDLGGAMVLAGTPGYVCAGFWWQVATGKLARWWRTHWVLDVNPHIRNVPQELADVRADFGWTEEDPAYRREYRGEWVTDESALVYAYTRERNSVLELPTVFRREEWLCTLGLDFGMRDATAWAVLGSHQHSRDVFVLHSHKETMLLPDEVAKVTAELVERFGPATIVGDSAGAAFIEEWNRRHAAAHNVWIEGADKLGKVGHIQLINGAFRSRSLRLLLPQAETLGSELSALPWLDANRTKEHPAYSNHETDALLYAWMRHRSYYHDPADEPLSKLAPDDWAAEMERIEADEGERMQRVPEYERW